MCIRDRSPDEAPDNPSGVADAFTTTAAGDTWNGAFWLATAGSFIVLIIDFAKWAKRPALSELVDAIESDVEPAK